jgi:hypothetical protein
MNDTLVQSTIVETLGRNGALEAKMLLWCQGGIIL